MDYFVLQFCRHGFYFGLLYIAMYEQRCEVFMWSGQFIYSYALSCDLESLKSLHLVVYRIGSDSKIWPFHYTRENSLMEYCKCKQSCDLYFIRLYKYLQTRTIIWLMFYSTYKYFKHEQSCDYFLQQYKYRIYVIDRLFFFHVQLHQYPLTLRI